MFDIALDIRTLSLTSVLFAIMSGAGLVAFGMAYPVFSGLRRVGTGMALIGLGFLLIGCRHHIPVALSVVVANTALVAGLMLINWGIQDFRRIPRTDTWLGVTIVASSVLALALVTYVGFSFPLRVFWISISLAVLAGMCCGNVVRGSAGGLIMPQKALVLGFVLFGAFALVRAWWVLDESTAQDFMTASAIHGLAFLAMILLLLTTTFGLIWMANEYLSLELRQYEQIISTMPGGIALVDRENRYRLVNDAILDFIGLNRQEVLGKRSLEVFGRDIYETVTVPNVQKAFAGETVSTTTWVDLPNTRKLYVAITYHPVPDRKGENAFVAIHIQDLTALYFAQQDKERIFDMSLDLFCVGGMDGYFKEVNPAWIRVLGWSQEELLARPWSDFLHPEDLEKAAEAEKRLAEGKPVVDQVVRVLTKEGAYKHISWMIYPDGDAQRIYSVGRDVSDRIGMEEELRELATKDSLTGADNRRVFMQRLNEEFARSTRYDTRLCLLMLDIDHFKVVNDTYGHAVGDRVLQLCVEVCAKTLRSTDAFGRIGGEEFAALLPHADLEFGVETAERLRANLSRAVLETDAGPLRFTVSVGVAELGPGDSVEQFMKRADDALYRAKEGGRDRVERG